jgi:hypothetical protein
MLNFKSAWARMVNYHAINGLSVNFGKLLVYSLKNTEPPGQMTMKSEISNELKKAQLVIRPQEVTAMACDLIHLRASGRCTEPGGTPTAATRRRYYAARFQIILKALILPEQPAAPL